MSEVDLMSIYITPFLIEVFVDKERGLFHIVTFRFEKRQKFVQLSEHVCSTYNFTVLVCLKEIVQKNIDINHIARYHRHDSYNHSPCIEYTCINQRVCGKFLHAYFNRNYVGLERDLLKYLWVSKKC